MADGYSHRRERIHGCGCNNPVENGHMPECPQFDNATDYRAQYLEQELRRAELSAESWQQRAEAAEAKLAATEGAVTFAGWVLDELRGDDGLGLDLDGGDAQEAMLRYGLLHEVEATEPCCDSCACLDALGEFPMACLRYTEAGKAAHAAYLTAAHVAAHAGGAHGR